MTTTGERSILQRQLEELELQATALRRRLESLATVPSSRELDLLVCRVRERRAALLLESVHEVVPAAQLVPLPDAPAWVPGLLDLRGVLVPVLDVAAFLLHAARRLELGDLIVVCDAGGRCVGLVVKEILGLERSRDEALQPLPEVSRLAPVVLGCARLGDAPVPLLSVAALLVRAGVPSARAEGDVP